MIDVNSLLAKSRDGIKLIDHSKAVSEVACMIYDITSTFKSPIKEEIRESIRIAGLLHDIGKCTESFQRVLNNDTNDGDRDEHSHNEIGYAFLYKHTKVDEFVLDAVYWHHGVNPLKFRGDSYKNSFELDAGCIETMKKFVIEVVGDGYLKDEVDIDDIDDIDEVDYPSDRPKYFRKPELLFTEEENQKFLLIRNCVISADRIVSNPSFDIADMSNYIKNFNRVTHKVDVNNHNKYDGYRYNNQLSLINKININQAQGNNTHIIKAPAGFGKTLIGLLWFLTSNKRLLWVCPRNDVAESVYKSILKELDGFNGTENINVELYLTGEVIERRYDRVDEKGFESDIIVTNIDNFLNTTVDNRYSHRLFTVTESNVIFDEYHELVGDAPLFSLFVIMMKLRHQKTNSNTLLLSATPSIMNFMWDTKEKKTIIEELYNSPQHNKSYKVNVIDYNDSTEVVEYNPDSSSVTIFNSISESQKYKKSRSDNPLLYHSRYTNEDRERILGEIYSLYDKDSGNSINKRNVVATHVLQASHDLSFKDLTEYVLSPESTLQRIGRCNRFGNYDDSTINIIFDSNNSNSKVTRILYDKKLSEEWYNHIKEHSGKQLNLTELYGIYNDFNQKKRGDIIKYLKKLYKDSLDKLIKIYPIKLNFKSDVKKTGGGKLRSLTNNDIFVIAKYEGRNNYTDPVAFDTYDNPTGTFKEDGGTRDKIIKVLIELKEDNRFDYKPLIDKKSKLTLDHLRYYAKRISTPYVRFDMVYSKEYGFKKIIN